MRRRVVLAVLVLALLALGGAAFAYTQLTDKPNDALDTELTGVSVETATGLVDTAPTTTAETEEPPPAELCWPFFGGDPQRQLSRPRIDLGRPKRVLWSRNMGD